MKAAAAPYVHRAHQPHSASRAWVQLYAASGEADIRQFLGQVILLVMVEYSSIHLDRISPFP